MRDSTLYIGALASNNVNNIVNDAGKYDEYKEKVKDLTKEKFPESYAVACRVADYIEKLILEKISDEEVGYLAIHIERIRHSV